MPLYRLHPAAVHFPIALLAFGFLTFFVGTLTPSRGWLKPAAGGLLEWGTVAAWVAAALGLLAQKTAPHIPAAWEDLADHKALGLWTVAAFTGLALWRRFLPGRGERTFLVFWALALGLMFAAAFHGGELVYEFGMGVGSPQ